MQLIPYTLINAICTVTRVDLPWWNRLILWWFGGERPETYQYTIKLKVTKGALTPGVCVILKEVKPPFFVASINPSLLHSDEHIVTCHSLEKDLRVRLAFKERSSLVVFHKAFQESNGGNKPT